MASLPNKGLALEAREREQCGASGGNILEQNPVKAAWN